MRAATRGSAPAVHGRRHLHGRSEAAGPGGDAGTAEQAQAADDRERIADETASTAGGAEAAGGKNATGTGGKGATNKATSKEKLSADSSGTTKAAAEILKPAGDVKLPPPTVQKGGKCESGAAGCDNGEFTGNFFGE